MNNMWSCSQSKMYPWGRTKFTLIFILRKFHYSIHSSGIFRQSRINCCGRQCYSLHSGMFEELGFCRLVSHAIGSEEELKVNSIQNFHSGKLWLLIFLDLWKISIVTQELFNLNLMLRLRTSIHPLTTDNSLMSPVCQPFRNGTNV